MAIYIENSIALQKIDKAFKDYASHDDFLQLFSDCRCAIIEAPTADVQEVKHAHWIPKRLGTCECSNCHEDYEVCGGLLGDYNYCPNCGAKMDGKD